MEIIFLLSKVEEQVDIQPVYTGTQMSVKRENADLTYWDFEFKYNAATMNKYIHKI